MITQTIGGVARYNNVAVAFHWIIAALVLIQLYVGFSFGGMQGEARTSWFNWHKTIGFSILILSLARLGWRIANPPPPFPPAVPGWEAVLARINHVLFYVVLIGLPMTGWLYLSTGDAAETSATTPLAMGLKWPFIPGAPKAGHDAFEQVHVMLVWMTLALLALHIAAALKHQFVDRNRIADRMPPFGIGDRR